MRLGRPAQPQGLSDSLSPSMSFLVGDGGRFLSEAQLTLSSRLLDAEPSDVEGRQEEQGRDDDRRLSLMRCSKGARRHRVKWFPQPLSAVAKISRTSIAGGGPFAIDKPSSGPSAARSCARRVEPLYDGGRMRETGRAGIRTLERACVTADARRGAPFDPNQWLVLISRSVQRRR